LTSTWTVKWVLGKEIMVSPDGTEWLRSDNEHADLCVLIHTPGLPQLFLKRGSSARILKAAARKARRLDRRTKRLHKENV
jgi:hypothetical protein